jgi:hypothetical protein
MALAQTTTPSSPTSSTVDDVSKWTSKQWIRQGQVGQGKRKMGRAEAVKGPKADRAKELHDQLSNLERVSMKLIRPFARHPQA